LASEKAHHNELFLPEFVRDAEKKLLDRANDIIALSISEKTAMCAEYSIDPNKITIAPNGIDDAFFKIPSLKTGTLCSSAVLFVGRTCRQKGIDVLLDATERLLNSGTIIFLRMIGGKYAEPSVDKSVKERIKKAPLASVVENLGEVTHDVVVSQMRKSFIYVQPSRYESQGIALLEAMASGRIVVASDLPAIREYIRHGENGLLVEPKNAQALADTLSTVFADPDKMISLGHEARKTARAYTWHNMLKIVLSLYNLQRK
jgi:glycosyltransferase involved in cell wall biosynthesis